MRLWAVVNSFNRVVIETGAPFDGEYESVLVELVSLYIRKDDCREWDLEQSSNWLSERGWSIVPLTDTLAEQYPEIVD